MVKTIEAGFREFHGRLTPTSGESQAAKKHRVSIEVCLEENFEIMRFFRTGSFGNGTSIRGYSDVDYFASIPTKNLKSDSDATLRQVRNALDARFPDTGVAVRTPAVLAPFGTDASESTEVVPADFIKRDENGNHIYEIADGDGGWMKSSPDVHNAYVAELNDKLGSKVKPLIRFLKAWKYYRNVPISSFYLELRVAKYASQENTIVYSIDVKNIFKLLWNNQLASLQDPKGISGYITACSSEAKKSDALSKLETAFTRAEKAREAEMAEKISEAFNWWNLVFAEQFPAYG
jgi:Second Messenger Oligonucleotide or Dinucleotide Synthetase domain